MLGLGKLLLVGVSTALRLTGAEGAVMAMSSGVSTSSPRTLLRLLESGLSSSALFPQDLCPPMAALLAAM